MHLLRKNYKGVDYKGFRLSVETEAKHIFVIKDLLLKKLKVVPLFIWLMTPNEAIWSLDQRTVIMR